MKYIYTIFFSLCAFTAFSQGSLDYLEADRPVQEIVAMDASKMILGTTDVKGTGPQSYLLIKKNAANVEQWSMTYGGTSYDRASDIMQTEDGGYLLLGSTSSYGAGNYDVLLIKVDSDGVQQWQRTYGAFHNDYADSFVKGDEGIIIIKAKKQYCETKNDFSDCTYGDWYLEISERGEVIRERDSTFGL